MIDSIRALLLLIAAYVVMALSLEVLTRAGRIIDAIVTAGVFMD